MKLVRALLLCGVIANCLGAETPPRITAAVEQANRHYGEGRFMPAYDGYRRAIELGGYSPDLFYNLGNAAYRLGRLGEAVLCYERTLWLDPGHGDAAFNLEHTRRLLTDKIEPPAPNLAGSAWEWAVSRVDVSAAGWIMLCLFAGLGLGLLAMSRLRLGPARQRAAGILGILLALNLAWGGLFAGLVWRRESGRDGVVLVKSLNVRSGPSEENPVLFTVHEGLKAGVVSQVQGWDQVLLPNGWNGWVPAAEVGLVQSEGYPR